MKFSEIISDEENAKGVSRRDILVKAAQISVVTAVLAAMPGCGGSGNGTSTTTGSGGATATDVAVLQFALNLEYLEAEFYTYATSGQGISTFGIQTSGIGTAGATTGGVQTTFTDPRIKALANEIAADERSHVTLERGALGAAAVAKPAINLAALGSFATQAEFLALARAFEDTGVSAYGGAAALLSPAVVKVAASILGTEAYHAGLLRLEVAENNVASKATDNFDVPPPPTGTQYVCADSQGLTIQRTPREVLNIVYAGGVKSGGFFPNGGNLSPSSVPLLGLS
ncbi:MAG TPA: ferritin-like domain-containing protein [Fimbriimonadaceae bacterium]|jgi:hypothetical protein